MIFFLHIPKTAGTSLNTVLKLQYKKHEIYPWENIKFHDKINEFKALPKNYPAKVNAKVLKGHYPFGLHDYVEGTHKYITFVRDPNKRLISHLIQFLRMPHSQVAEDFKKGTSVVEILKNHVFFNNAQVKWISGLSNDLQITDEVRYEKAIENIENHFAFIGLTERFDESLLLLKGILNWKYPPYYSSFNVSKDLEKEQLKLTIEELNFISELNYYDLKLYNYCVDRFQKVLYSSNIYLNSFQKQLYIFQKAHQTYLYVKKIIN